MADVGKLEPGDRYQLLGCVTEEIVSYPRGYKTLEMVEVMANDYPEMQDSSMAPYLAVALYRVNSYNTAEYLLSHTAANIATPLKSKDKARFKGLTLPQYHAYQQRVNLADLYIEHGAVMAQEGLLFRHWLYDNATHLVGNPKLHAFLEKHGISINEQDAQGRTILLRAMKERPRIASQLINLGADDTIADSRNNTAHDMLIKSRGTSTMEMPSPGLPADLMAISPAQFTQKQNLRAEPLPLNQQETLFLYDDNGQTRLERWNWLTEERHTVRLPLPSIASNNKPIRYVTLATKDGIWVLGPISILVTRNDQVRELTLTQETEQGDFVVSPLTLPTINPDSIFTPLNDGSLLALVPGSNKRDFYGYRIFLNDSNKGQVEWKKLSVPSGLGGGSVASRLADGRVLVAGGSHHSKHRAWLFDPKTDLWRDTGELNIGRAYPAIAALADGRAFVAGGNNLFFGKKTRGGFSAEIWDPASERWSFLPEMPLSYGIEAYRAQGPSATVLPDSSLVVAGGMHEQVFLLRSQGGKFASRWSNVGTLPRQRIDAKVQALGNSKLVVAGGWGMTPKRRCCWSRSGGDMLNWDESLEFDNRSIGLQHQEPAIAHRKGSSLIAGGWRSYSLSFRNVQASSSVELVDHEQHRAELLTQLPRPMLYGQALWIDDTRILVKSASYDKHIKSRLSRMDPRALESNDTGYLATYNPGSGKWRMLDDERIAHSELAGISGDEAILIGPGVTNWAVDINQLSVRKIPQRIAVRAGAVSRVLDDGRVIVAGGRSQSVFIQAADMDCMAQDCPLSWFSLGELEPSDRYEILDPGTDQWRFSTVKQVSAEEAVIRNNGSVVTLGWQNDQWIIEGSTPDGSQWSTVPKPGDTSKQESDGIPVCERQDYSANTCRLAVGVNPESKEDYLFFVARNQVGNKEATYSLWLFSDTEQRWMRVADELTGSQYSGTLNLDMQADGKLLKGTFFNTDHPRLWWE